MRTSLFFLLRLCITAGLLLVVARGSMGDPAPPQSTKQDLAQVLPTTKPDTESPGNSSARVDRLIRQLGDDRFELRQEAQDELAKLGFAAFESLRAAASDEDLEIASRARYLLRLIRVDFSRPGDPVEVASLLAGFHLLQQREQVTRLQKLASLRDGRGIAALCRVIRFEPSIVLAKQAAVAILKQYPSEQVAMDRLATMLRDNLQPSRRLPSLWMLSYAKFHDSPEEAWQQWEKWTKQERELVKRNDQGTNSRIVSELVTQQINWVLRMDGPPRQLVDKIQLMCEFRGRREKGMKALITWLVEQKAWENLGVSPLMFAQRLAGDPRSFVYALAKRYAETGKRAAAEAAAERAFRLEGASPRESQRLHLLIGLQLQNEGYYQWAEREFRHVIDSGNLDDPYVRDAYDSLGAMLHDQAEDLRAAKVLEEFAKATRKDVDFAKTGGTTAPVMARMNYYRACHWKAAGNVRKQRLSLDAGLALDPTNIDLLIAGYNLPDADPVFRNKVRELIKQTSIRLRVQLVGGTDRVMVCNDLAWLIANTKGNFDEAIRLSQESLRRLHNHGAFYDTLARCYFAKGDHENAVKYQIKAAELEPHRGLIIRQLEQFRETYEQKLGKPAPKPKTTKRPPQGPRLLKSTSVPAAEFDKPVPERSTR